jgi:predicted nuclease of predicted toxin-antitoxin system
MERATAEGRIILTFDRDFGELVYGRGFSQPEGIAYFRMGSLAPEEPAATLLRLLEEGEVTFEGNLTVVSRNRTRQRSL